MADKPDELRQILAELHRLVDALDRRVPRPERDTERAIASDAATLRAKALDLIRKLERATT